MRGELLEQRSAGIEEPPPDTEGGLVDLVLDFLEQDVSEVLAWHGHSTWKSRAGTKGTSGEGSGEVQRAIGKLGDVVLDGTSPVGCDRAAGVPYPPRELVRPASAVVQVSAARVDLDEVRIRRIPSGSQQFVVGQRSQPGAWRGVRERLERLQVPV